MPRPHRLSKIRRDRRRTARVVRPQRLLRYEHLEDRAMMAVTPGTNLSTGSQLTTYTLALATTAEFTQSAGGKAATHALLDQFVAEFNKIYETELAIRFVLH